MSFQVEQLGDNDDLAVVRDTKDLIGSAEVVENTGLRETDIDALEDTHVANVLRAPSAHDWQDSEIVSIIEDGCQIVCNLQISRIRARVAGYDRNRILIGLFVLINADPSGIVSYPFD